MDTAAANVTLDGLTTAAIYEISVQAHSNWFYGPACALARVWDNSHADNNANGLPDE